MRREGGGRDGKEREGRGEEMRREGGGRDGKEREGGGGGRR